MVQVQLRIPEKDRDALKRIARERGISFSELIRRLLSKALKDNLQETI
jgi:Ribbon-helix-helix protein, copG family.